MRYSNLIALAICWMAVPTVSTPAVEPTADQRLRTGRQSPLPPDKKRCVKKRPSVFGDSGLIRFRLVGGRLEVDPSRYRKGSAAHEFDEYRESITVSISSGIPAAYYQFQDDYQRIQLVAEHGKSIRIESTILATGERGILEQRPDGRVYWGTLRDPAGESALDRKVSGSTLLHIVGQDEAGFHIHLEGLTKRMLQGRSLIDLANETEQHLRQHADQLAVVSREQVESLIEQLRSPKIRQRRSAFKQLSRLGTRVTPHLATAARRDDLDTEQRSRIQTLLNRYPRLDEDTPSSLACLLSMDRHHWQIMSARMNQVEWIAANAHIRRCGLETLQR